MSPIKINHLAFKLSKSGGLGHKVHDVQSNPCPRSTARWVSPTNAQPNPHRFRYSRASNPAATPSGEREEGDDRHWISFHRVQQSGNQKDPPPECFDPFCLPARAARPRTLRSPAMAYARRAPQGGVLNQTSDQCGCERSHRYHA